MRPRSFTQWSRIVAGLAICVLLTSEQLTLAAQSLAEFPSSGTEHSIQIYSAADSGSLPVGILPSDESPTPIAEVQGTSGRWFLVRTKAGIVGWITETNSNQTKKVATFFKSLPAENTTVAAPIPNLASGTSPRGSLLVPVLSLGRSSIVSATFNHTITGNLMLDTGSTHTVISQRLAGLLNLRPSGRATVQTVGGAIAVAVARLRSLKLGEAEINDLAILIHDFSPDPRIEGLLGMDFLGRYRFGLDAERQLLVLAPR